MPLRFLSVCGLLAATVACSQSKSNTTASQPKAEAPEAEVAEAEPPAGACATLSASNRGHVEALAAAMEEALGMPVTFVKGWAASGEDENHPGCSLVVVGDGVDVGLGDRPAASEQSPFQMDGLPKTAPSRIWRFNMQHLEAVVTTHRLSMSGAGASGVTEEMSEYALDSLRCNLTTGYEIDDWSICDGPIGYCDALGKIPPEEQTHRYELYCWEVAEAEG
jgi:hypothetical protein